MERHSGKHIQKELKHTQHSNFISQKANERVSFSYFPKKPSHNAKFQAKNQ